jgi:methylenetetrahydrofolate dehydrogenase (NADP+)/methenyltetrahydrofolate cyclohydrolase
MSIILSGKEVIKDIKDRIKEHISILKSTPRLGIYLKIDDDPARIYSNSIIKKASKLGIEAEIVQVDPNISADDFKKLYDDTQGSFDGIIFQRPFPNNVDINLINKIIDPNKDIDSVSSYNLGKIIQSNNLIAPATAMAVIDILEYYNIPIRGANVSIIGRSVSVGRPLAMLLLQKHATPTVCHTKTKDIPSITKNSDIVVVSAGKPKLLNKDYFTENSIVIDVGINYVDGKIVGDVNFDDVSDFVKAITPVPGGVGTVTTYRLLLNLLEVKNASK